jgi:cyclopropane fatty-acyl-phospholipid synthase-like methyltransferase
MDAIAQLLRDVEPETFDRLLTVSNLTPVGQQAYDRVIENAKRYYALDEDGQEAVDAIVLEQASLL